MDTLTKQDIELLIGAINLWSSQPLTDHISMGMMSLMMAPKEHQEKAKKDFTKKGDEASSECKSRKERAIMLQAKLIGMKDSLVAESELALAATPD